MASRPSRYDILETYPAADDAEWLSHALGFVASFVIPAKKDRWRELFTLRPQRIIRSSHKLHSDLDRRACVLVPSLADLRGDGVFYDFVGMPRIVPSSRVEELAGAGDAIFSLAPGELAVYLFHESELWLCRSSSLRR